LGCCGVFLPRADRAITQSLSRLRETRAFQNPHATRTTTESSLDGAFSTSNAKSQQFGVSIRVHTALAPRCSPWAGQIWLRACVKRATKQAARKACPPPPTTLLYAAAASRPWSALASARPRTSPPRPSPRRAPARSAARRPARGAPSPRPARSVPPGRRRRPYAASRRVGTTTSGRRGSSARRRRSTPSCAA